MSIKSDADDVVAKFAGEMFKGFDLAMFGDATIMWRIKCDEDGSATIEPVTREELYRLTKTVTQESQQIKIACVIR